MPIKDTKFKLLKLLSYMAWSRNVRNINSPKKDAPLNSAGQIDSISLINAGEPKHGGWGATTPLALIKMLKLFDFPILVTWNASLALWNVPWWASMPSTAVHDSENAVWFMTRSCAWRSIFSLFFSIVLLFISCLHTS